MIKVNDDVLDWKDGMTVVDLLNLMEYPEYNFPIMVVSINGKHIPNDKYAETLISKGDEVKVMQPLAGG
ncbi:MAG: hypothetical protein HPY66_0335 [Firmicutes bacterium]|nr:hypothetical protein [Bacillota bacterium]MDI6704756.1 sulfur carrier protein ThiS [Bacillota bacterium]